MCTCQRVFVHAPPVAERRTAGRPFASRGKVMEDLCVKMEDAGEAGRRECVWGGESETWVSP